jgi:hypothetical protein
MTRYWLVGPAGNLVNDRAMLSVDEVPKVAEKAFKGTMGSTVQARVIVEEVNYQEWDGVIIDPQGRAKWAGRSIDRPWVPTLKELAPFAGTTKLPTYPPEVHEELNRDFDRASKEAKTRAKIYEEAAKEQVAIYEELKVKAERLRDYCLTHKDKAEKLRDLCLQRTAELAAITEKLEAVKS